jgi:uncharacterized BrkB/YihY/UPF0761 family membrane protein
MRYYFYKDNYFKLFIFLAIFLAFFVIFTSVLKAGTSIDDAITNLDATAKTGYGQEPSSLPQAPQMIGQVVGAGLAFIGVIFLILMIYGGFIWMIARGNQQEVTKAKDLITAAVIGIIIVLAAYAITQYLGGALGMGQQPTP